MRTYIYTVNLLDIWRAEYSMRANPTSNHASRWSTLKRVDAASRPFFSSPIFPPTISTYINVISNPVYENKNFNCEIIGCRAIW